MQTLGLTVKNGAKNEKFSHFCRNKCEIQQRTVPLYISKSFKLIQNFYCCRQDDILQGFSDFKLTAQGFLFFMNNENLSK